MQKRNLMFLKTILFCIFLAFACVIFLKVYFWKSLPGNKIESSHSMYKCIYEDQKRQEVVLNSMDNKFKITFVESGSQIFAF